MIVDELPDAPDPATDPASVFSAKAAAMVMAQKRMVPQINAALGALSAFAAGGVYSFQYVFDSATADADPGVGKLRLGSATQNAALVIRIDNAISGGTDISAVFNDLLSSTSTVKGSMKVVKVADPTKWLAFDITGSAGGSGYRDLVGSVRASSAANPFANGDPVMVFIERMPDVVAGAMARIGNPLDVASGTALINFRSSFDSAKYRKYIVELENLVHTTQLLLRGAVGGVAVTSSGGAFGDVSTATTDTTSGTFFLTATNSGITTGTLEFRGPHYTGDKSIGYRGYSLGPSSSRRFIAREGMLIDPGSLSGFELGLQGGGVFSGGRVTLWGVT